MCHSCTTILSLPWDLKTKESINQPRYGRVYNCEYYLIIGSHNNWIILNFIDEITYEEYYGHINLTTLYRNVMNISLIIMEGNYGAIYDDDYTLHGYYIIIFISSPYNLRSEFSIYGQVISSIEMVCD